MPPLTIPEPSVLLPSPSLPLYNRHAAGIDIGEAEHWVALPPDRAPQPVCRLGTFTADLDALADWLLDCGITTVAMESTGVYWIPLFELLEARGLQVFLIDPRQAQRAPGRPTTDRLDCQWLQRLHAYGLLAAAFRPDDQVCVLRASLQTTLSTTTTTVVLGGARGEGGVAVVVGLTVDLPRDGPDLGIALLQQSRRGPSLP